MEDLTNPAGIIITDDNTDQGFYTYSMDGDNYKLEDANELKLNADYDDEDGYMDGLTVTSVYNKSGKGLCHLQRFQADGRQVQRRDHYRYPQRERYRQQRISHRDHLHCGSEGCCRDALRCEG